jgi:hypothetical protein
MRLRAIGLGAIQATYVIAVGFVGIFILNLITWLIEQTQGESFQGVLQVSSRIWLNAHFVSLHLAAGNIAGIKSPAYDFTLVPLGFSALIGWLIFRAGRQIAQEENLGASWFGAIIVYLMVAIALTSASFSKNIYVEDWQGTFFPTAIFAALLILGSITGEVDSEGNLRARVRGFFLDRFDKLPWAIKPLISPALRAGTAVVAGLFAIGSVVISVLFVLNWVDIIRLYQSLQLSFLGTLTVSFGQLALLPNVLVYVASWFTGVGFSLGQGSMVSPLATELGPLPAIPMLAALPAQTNSMLIVFVLVPVLLGFGATLLIKAHTADLRFKYASATSAAIGLGLAIGFVAALEMAILADFASGSIGPARMNEFGINPWLLFAVTFIEVSVASILAAFFSARPEGVDAELVSRIRRVK